MQPCRQTIQIRKSCSHTGNGILAFQHFGYMIHCIRYNVSYGHKIRSALPVGNTQDCFFRLIHNIPHIFRAVISHGRNGCSAFHQLSQKGFFFHYFGMILGIGSRRYYISQQRNIGDTAYIFQFILFVQFIDHRNHIYRFVFGMQRKHSAENHTVGLPVEIFRHQFFSDQSHCVLIDQHGADHGLFRFYILRRHSVLHGNLLLFFGTVHL